MCFLQTHNQGLRQLFLTVSFDLFDKRSTPDGVLVSLRFWKHRKRQVEGPCRALFQLKKSQGFKVQGSETEKRELLGGREEKSVYPTVRGLAWRANQ